MTVVSFVSHQEPAEVFFVLQHLDPLHATRTREGDRASCWLACDAYSRTSYAVIMLRCKKIRLVQVLLGTSGQLLDA